MENFRKMEKFVKIKENLKQLMGQETKIEKWLRKEREIAKKEEDKTIKSAQPSNRF